MSDLIKYIDLLPDTPLKAQIRRLADAALRNKEFGLVYDPCAPEKVVIDGKDKVLGDTIYPGLEPVGIDNWVDNRGEARDAMPAHILIEAENYQALQMLTFVCGDKEHRTGREADYRGQVDCIYIDPPYNTGEHSWKYNNDYVDSSDKYRHSKWLSMMERRLRLAKRLLKRDSVLICAIDEKEYLHLGCLLEQMFTGARIQMVSTVTNPSGVARGGEFYRTNEYLFFVKIGNAAPVPLPLEDNWRGNAKGEHKDMLYWRGLLRGGTNARRIDRPNLFYPIYVSEDGKKIVSIGDSLDKDADRNTVTPMMGTRAVWPIRSNGEEGNWQLGRDSLSDAYKKGYVRLGGFTDRGMAIKYIASGEQKKVEKGLFKIIGYREDSSIIVDESGYQAEFVPGTVWNIQSHSALYHGSQMLNKILCGKRFDFPKSVYAVRDAIRFFVADKPDALVLDFFAGSNTTAHAVSLLNAEDGGRRRCISVTNNEVSFDEARTMRQQRTPSGEYLHPGMEEWEKWGIARYVAWPRIKCAIEGHDAGGAPLKGEYADSTLKMASGLGAASAFYRLRFIEKKESIALGRQLLAILPMMWLRAGSYGVPPLAGEGAEERDMLMLGSSGFAVLLHTRAQAQFAKEVQQDERVKMAFIVTDNDGTYSGVRDLVQRGGRKVPCVHLYKDYLENFAVRVSYD